MDLFNSMMGEVDLDDPSVYRSPEWEDHKTVAQLRSWAWSLLGESLVYMDFLHADMDWEPQKTRVKEFCKRFAENFWTFTEDSEDGRRWWRKFIWKFRDEVENQC